MVGDGDDEEGLEGVDTYPEEGVEGGTIETLGRDGGLGEERSKGRGAK